MPGQGEESPRAGRHPAATCCRLRTLRASTRDHVCRSWDLAQPKEKHSRRCGGRWLALWLRFTLPHLVTCVSSPWVGRVGAVHSLYPSPTPPDSQRVKARVREPPPQLCSMGMLFSGAQECCFYRVQPAGPESRRAAALGLGCGFIFHKHRDPDSSCLAVCCWGDACFVVEVSCRLRK